MKFISLRYKIRSQLHVNAADYHNFLSVVLVITDTPLVALYIRIMMHI